MSDPTVPPPVQSITAQISALFSSPVLTAFRYALTSLGSVLALVGVVALSPSQIDHIISVAQQIGTTLGAIVALIGIVTPIAMAIFGMLTSTVKAQIDKVKEIATGPAGPVAVSAQKALISATSAVAQDPSIPTSHEARDTLVAATIALPDVQTIVGTKEMASKQPSASVVAQEDVAVISKKA